MRKIHIILFITIGFFLIPTLTYACGSNSEKKCCKPKTEKAVEKDCCKKEKGATDEEGCGGNCGKSSCNCPQMITSAFTVIPITYIEYIAFVIPVAQKEFHYSEIYISSAFDNLRLPPKIS